MILRRTLLFFALASIALAASDRTRGFSGGVNLRKKDDLSRKLKKDKSQEVGEVKEEKKKKAKEGDLNYPFANCPETLSCDGLNRKNGEDCTSHFNCISNFCYKEKCMCKICNFNACSGCAADECCVKNPSGAGNICTNVKPGPQPLFERLHKNDPDGDEGEACECDDNTECVNGCCLDLQPYHRCVCAYPNNPFLHCMNCPWTMQEKCKAAGPGVLDPHDDDN